MISGYNIGWSIQHLRISDNNIWEVQGMMQSDNNIERWSIVLYNDIVSVHEIVYLKLSTFYSVLGFDEQKW